MGQMEWFLIAVVFALVLGVTLICTICSMAKWVYQALVDEFQAALKGARGLADEDARLAKEYRELMSAFTATALEREKGSDLPTPVLLQCKRLVAGRCGLEASFVDMPIYRQTTYSGMRLNYRGDSAVDMRWRGGDQFVMAGDVLKLTYTLGRESLLAVPAEAVAVKPAACTDPMFDPLLDVGQPKPEDIN